MDGFRHWLWVVMFLVVGCQAPAVPFERTERTVTQGRVKEVLQAGPYTYVLVSIDDDALWVATLQQERSVGNLVKVTVFGRRKDFHSARLNRTFGQLAFGMVQTAQGETK